VITDERHHKLVVPTAKRHYIRS